jgi:hypothetical protein
VSVFCNLAASLTAPRRTECIHEAHEESLPRLALHWFINIGGELASNPISSRNHPGFPFRKPVFGAPKTALTVDGPYSGKTWKKRRGIYRPRGGKL